MTVVSTRQRNDYTGSGIVGPYAYNYRVFAATDLRVVIADPEGNDTTLNYPADYSVTGAGNKTGGTISLTAALPVDWKLTVLRELPLTQTRAIRNQGPFFPETVEDALDALTMQLQQLQDGIDRSFKVPFSVDPTTIGAEITNFAPSNYLRVRSDGLGLEGVANVVASQSFLQSGAGAVTRSANSKMAEVFSVTDFGATGNGVTNDGPAILLCYTAAQAAGRGAIVLYPPGLYNMGSTTITATQSQIKSMSWGGGITYANLTDTIPEGRGLPAVRLRWASNPSSNIGFDLYTNQVFGWEFDGLCIDGNAVLKNGIKFQGANVFRNGWTRGCTEKGGWSPDLVNNSVSDNWSWSYNTGWGLYLDGPNATTFFSINSRYRVNGASSGVGGLFIGGGNGMVFFQDTFESNNGFGAHILHGNGNQLKNISFLGRPHFENNGQLMTAGTGYSLVIDGFNGTYTPSYITVEGGYFQAAASNRLIHLIRCQYVSIKQPRWAAGDTTHHLVATANATDTLIEQPDLLEGSMSVAQILAQGTRTMVRMQDGTGKYTLYGTDVEISSANAYRILGADGATSRTIAKLGLASPAVDVVELAGATTVVSSGSLMRIPQFAAVDLLAGNAANAGLFCLDPTNSTIVFYIGTTRLRVKTSAIETW